MIPAPANIQRSVSEFNNVEKLILEYTKDEQFLIFWHAILLKEKEDSDVFYASEYRFVKVYPAVFQCFDFVLPEFCILFL